MRIMSRVVIKSLAAIRNIVLVMFMFMSICAILAIQVWCCA
jgi:hypothetical protein